jgi:REP-associated tyrosine transposase
VALRPFATSLDRRRETLAASAEVSLARLLRVELTGAVYHVIARGNERKAIFRDDRDREIYLERLAECRERFRLRVLAYCLMSNHIHVAVERGPFPLSRAMLALHSFYAQRFNSRHRRSGHLFQGRYRAFLVQDDKYLFALLRYIHLNPVRAGMVDRPESYSWSSDRCYRSGRGPDWLDLDVALGRLSSDRKEAAAAYRRMMGDQDQQSYEDVVSLGFPVRGDPEFIQRSVAIVGETVRLPSGWTPESLADAVAKAEGSSLEVLRRAGKSAAASRSRLIAAYLGRREGFSIARMARCFRREESTFHRGLDRLERLMTLDDAVRGHVDRLACLFEPGNTGIHD